MKKIVIYSLLFQLGLSVAFGAYLIHRHNGIVGANASINEMRSCLENLI